MRSYGHNPCSWRLAPCPIHAAPFWNMPRSRLPLRRFVRPSTWGSMKELSKKAWKGWATSDEVNAVVGRLRRDVGPHHWRLEDRIAELSTIATFLAWLEQCTSTAEFALRLCADGPRLQPATLAAIRKSSDYIHSSLEYADLSRTTRRANDLLANALARLGIVTFGYIIHKWLQATMDMLGTVTRLALRVLKIGHGLS